MIIEPSAFERRMAELWLSFDNQPNAALRETWRQMASVYGDTIASHGTPSGELWNVLQPPTGTGKTVGLCLYCAMLAERNAALNAEDAYSDQNKVGVLIVTRLIRQADEVVENINKLAGGPIIALARHSETNVTADQMREADILVITHQAYMNAVEGLAKDSASNWSNFIDWKHGERRLTIIDEALANCVEESQVTLDNVNQVIGLIPPRIAQEYPRQLYVLKFLKKVLSKIGETFSEVDEEDREGLALGRPAFNASKAAMPKEAELIPMTALRRELNSVDLGLALLGRRDAKTNQALKTKVDRVLKGVDGIMRRWAYYAKKGKLHTLNYSELLLPNRLPGPVVLDATAKQQFLWDLFADRVKVHAAPEGSRSYSNVTLHVARLGGIGKNKMIEEAKDRLPRLIANLEGNLEDHRTVFMCCHKGVEPLAMTYEPKFDQYKLAHWGAVDGLNDFKELDTAVLLGLPYRDHIWSANIYQAFKGPQSEDWFRQKAKAIKHQLNVRQLSVSVIQAANRVRCRKVIDDKGNCLPTDIFLTLPKDRTGDEILAAVQREMPGISVTEWDLQWNGEKKPKVRRGSYSEALVAFMKTCIPGRYTASDIKAALGISQASWSNIAKELRKAESTLSVSLKELGVAYLSSGKGSASYLIKD